MLAVTLPEHSSLIVLLNDLNLSVVSRRTAMRRTGDMFHRKCKSVKNQLQGAEYVCTTPDVWSTKRQSFLGVPCHCVDEELVKQSPALPCNIFCGSHTYDNIAQFSFEISFGFATVTDNNTNFVMVFKEFGVTF